MKTIQYYEYDNKLYQIIYDNDERKCGCFVATDTLEMEATIDKNIDNIIKNGKKVLLKDSLNFIIDNIINKNKDLDRQ